MNGIGSPENKNIYIFIPLNACKDLHLKQQYFILYVRDFLECLQTKKKSKKGVGIQLILVSLEFLNSN